jgi:hypothetical protein
MSNHKHKSVPSKHLPTGLIRDFARQVECASKLDAFFRGQQEAYHHSKAEFGRQDAIKAIADLSDDLAAQVALGEMELCLGDDPRITPEYRRAWWVEIRDQARLRALDLPSSVHPRLAAWQAEYKASVESERIIEREDRIEWEDRMFEERMERPKLRI